MTSSRVEERKIIRREELSNHHRNAMDMEDARHMLESPKVTARRLFEEGRQAGYEAGFEEGRREFAQAIINAVDAVRDRLFNLEDQLLPLVKSAVEKIIGHIHPDDLVRRVIREALTEVGAGISVTIRAAPDEIEAIRGAIEESFFSDHIEFPQIRHFEPDASLKPGEIVLESIQGRVHIGVEYQLNRLKTGLDAAS